MQRTPQKSSFKTSLGPGAYLDEFTKWQQGGAAGPLPDFRGWTPGNRKYAENPDDLRVILELLQRMIKPKTSAHEDMVRYMGGKRPDPGMGGTWGESYESLYELLGGGK